MNPVAELVRRTRRSDERHLALSETDLADRPGVRAALARAGLVLVVAERLSPGPALRSLGRGSAVLVIVDAGSRSGVRLLDFIERQVERIRTRTPYSGVVVVAGADVDWRLLPARTWVLAEGRPPDIDAKVGAVLEHRQAYEDAFESWPAVAASQSGRRRPRPLAAIPHTVPNFNVRHPAMLVPIARAAAAMGTPVVCELSPQEALTYDLGRCGSRDDRRRIRAAMERMREDVSLVSDATGADMRLHLDHCDDPELIVHALGVGFDSLMADGSARSLTMNVRFTRRAVELASTFGVSVEGEVGSMDPHARRRTSRTLVEDLREFVERTEVAYVGLNAGQVHGSDYDYRRSRRALRDIEDLDRIHGGDDLRSLSQACVELDARLAAAGVDARQPDRRCLLRIRERLVEEPGSQAQAVLGEAYAAVPTGCWRLLGQLEQAWQQRRLGVATRRSALYGMVASAGGLTPGRDQQRFLDLGLLRQASAAVAGTGTRLVLHGGSSVAYEELPLLRTLGVARLNVGSRPFHAFVQALESRSPTRVRLDETWDAVRFLAEHAADWRRWLADPPSFLAPYQDELCRRYFVPLLG